jgi:hypothetical protein
MRRIGGGLKRWRALSRTVVIAQVENEPGGPRFRL